MTGPALVRDWMTAPVVVETPDASMTKLVAVMRLRRISAVPIVADGEVAGLVSTTDVLRASATARASDVMSKVVVTVGEEERVDVHRLRQTERCLLALGVVATERPLLLNRS